MKLINYKFINSRFYRNDTEVTEELVKSELRKPVFEWLLKTGECRARDKSDEKPIEKKEKQIKILEVKPKVISDDKLFEKHKHDYKIEMAPYKGKLKLGIERKNKKYGYFNFVCYIESEDDFKQAVINDIKSQEKLAKDKKQPKEIIDDDI